jgi:hypothetical protein
VLPKVCDTNLCISMCQIPLLIEETVLLQSPAVMLTIPLPTHGIHPFQSLSQSNRHLLPLRIASSKSFIHSLFLPQYLLKCALPEACAVSLDASHGKQFRGRQYIVLSCGSLILSSTSKRRQRRTKFNSS